jgi:hypothetical protein
MNYSIKYKIMSKVFAFSVLSGCGTYVPEIQEPWVSPGQGEVMVQDLVKHIHCEVERAVKGVITQDKKFAAFNGERVAEWLEKWGVQIALNLTVEESSNLNPGVTFNTPIIPANVAFPGLKSPISMSQMFNFGLGGTLSSDATRIDKLSTYYTVKQLLTEPSFCPAPGDPPQLSLLESDLRIQEWLADAVFLQGTEAADFSSKAIESQFKQNVISHEVKFLIVSSGNITPSWKLVRVSANPSSFFGANRTRTHDLTVTFGPNVEIATTTRTKKNQPSQAASNAQLASEIGLAVANSLRSVTLQINQ